MCQRSFRLCARKHRKGFCCAEPLDHCAEQLGRATCVDQLAEEKLAQSGATCAEQLAQRMCTKAHAQNSLRRATRAEGLEQRTCVEQPVHTDWRRAQAASGVQGMFCALRGFVRVLETTIPQKSWEAMLSGQPSFSVWWPPR